MPTTTDRFRVETDGSGVGLGAVLSQLQNDIWHPVAFISHSLSDAERNYHAADLEMAAIVFTLKEWRHYLVDAAHPFEILTDHQNLTYFKKPQDLNRQQARWAHFLQQYHFTMTHRSGKTNPADPLSRRPDFEKGVELDNTARILLPEQLFSSPPHSPVKDVAAVRSLQVEKQSNNAEAAVHLSNSIESMVESLQHKREKYAQSAYPPILPLCHSFPLPPSFPPLSSWNSTLASAVSMTHILTFLVLRTSLLEKGVMSEPFLSSHFT